MKSQTSLAARNCRLQKGSQMVHFCNNRPIEMSVDEWCRKHSITTLSVPDPKFCPQFRFTVQRNLAVRRQYSSKHHRKSEFHRQ